MKIHELFNEMGVAIDEWGSKNFPIKLPAWGVLEEIGELTHCLLKRHQKIRDMDKDDIFRKNYGDALADTIVYLLHDASINNMRFVEQDFPGNEIAPLHIREPIDITDPVTVQEKLAELANDAVVLLEGIDYGINGEEIHVSIMRHCDAFARGFGIDLIPLLQKTWDKVKERNWKENPSNANVIAGEVEG